MTQQIINLGTAANAGDGDNIRVAFDKCNDNFTELYTAGPAGSNISISGNTVSNSETNANIVITPNGIGKVVVSNSLIPSADNTHDVGSNTNRFKTVYAGSTGVVSSGPITLPQYANATVRDATITTPAAGMMVLTGNTFQGYNGTSWVDFN